MMVSVLLVLVGIMLLGAGLFYLSKNKQDAESRKIYGITALDRRGGAGSGRGSA